MWLATQGAAPATRIRAGTQSGHARAVVHEEPASSASSTRASSSRGRSPSGPRGRPPSRAPRQRAPVLRPPGRLAGIDREQRIPDGGAEGAEGARPLRDAGPPEPRRDRACRRRGTRGSCRRSAALDSSVARDHRRPPVHRDEGAPAVRHREQKDRYLPRLATGEMVAAFALTEPGAGSDAAAIQTRADRRGDGATCSTGRRCGSPTAASPTSSRSSRAPPRPTTAPSRRSRRSWWSAAWGVRSGPSEHKLGIRGSSTTEVFFEDVRVPAANVLGEPGRGFKVAMEVLNSGRLGLASGCVGAVQARPQDGGRARARSGAPSAGPSASSGSSRTRSP